MSVIVEEIALPDGGRMLIYDDGSQYEVHGSTMVMREGPHSDDRGVDARAVLAATRATTPRLRVDPANPEDMAWLREQITLGNFTRESHPLRRVPPDEYLIVTDRAGWAYLVGRRHQAQYASSIIGRMGSIPLYGDDKYLWGVRGSEAARTAWRRDFARAHPGTALLTSTDTEAALADTGIAPEAADLTRAIRSSPAEITRAIMGISRAALEADEHITSYFQRYVAQYNGDGLPGSIVAVIAGVVEFVVRFVVGIAALPAALEMLFAEFGNIMQAIDEAIPDILQGLQEAPLETLRELASIVLSTLASLTGLTDIRDEGARSLEAAGEGRDAESSLHITRATTRILELITIVRGLVTGLRRLPAIARRLRTQLQRINQLLTRTRAARAALRSGGVAAIEEAGETGSRARTRRSGTDPRPEGPEHTRAPETSEPTESVRHRSEADEVAEGLGVDEAIAEDAPYGARETVDPDRAGRVRTRRADGTSTRLDTERRALHRLQTQILTPAQMRAARRIVGQRLNSRLRQLWRSLINQLDRDDLAEIRRLLRLAERETSSGVAQAMREGAYEIARTRMYPRMAVRFWNAVHDQERIAQIFRSAGLTLRRGRVPAWILPDGTEVRLSLEHLTRVSDNPLLAIDPNNLSIVPLAENSDLLEAIRAIAHFGDFAGSH